MAVLATFCIMENFCLHFEEVKTFNEATNVLVEISVRI